jgi:metal-responsive CopG/Arc/MetJ family transcriptional regulator
MQRGKSADHCRFGAYESMRLKIAEAFCPRILVIPSEKAKQICNSNFLTPAEFFSPFAKNLDLKELNKSTSDMYNQEYSGEKIPTFTPQYRNITLVDVEEWQPAQESAMQESFQESLNRNAPKIQEISGLSAFDITDRSERSLSTYGWDPALNLTVDYLRSLSLEHEWSNLNQCHALLYVISSDEKNLEQAVMAAEKKYNDTISKATGARPTDSHIIRIIVVLITDESGDNKSDVDPHFKSMNTVYSQALTTIVKLNDSQDTASGQNNIWNDGAFYIKRTLKSYDLGVDKVDSNNPDLKRGRKIDKSNFEHIRNSMNGIFVTKLIDKFKTQLRNQWETVFNQKKSVKKGFMGLFRKEEKPYVKDGYYFLTDLEKEVKKYADFLLSLGMINEAKQEYDYVVDNLAKKSAETTNALNEMIMYCNIAIPNLQRPGFPSEKMKYVNRNMLDHLARSINYPYRYSRLLMIMNLLNHCYYDAGEEPPREAQRAIYQGHFKFSVKHNVLMLDFLSPFLLQQYSRYSLLNSPKNIRTFFAQTVECSAIYIKRVNLKRYSLAGYLLCSKYYGGAEKSTWGVVNELVFYNLAVLTKEYISDDKLELESFIATLNNMENSPFGPSEIVKKADKAIRLKISDFKKIVEDADQMSEFQTYDDPLSRGPTQSMNLTESQMMFSSNIAPKNIVNLQTLAATSMKMLSFRGYAIITPNELTKTLVNEEDIDLIPDEVDSTAMPSSMSMTSSTSMQKKTYDLPAFAPGTTAEKAEVNQSLAKHLEIFDNIVKAKFPQGCQDTLKPQIDLARVSSLGRKMNLTYRPREVTQGETVLYQFKVKNQFWSRIDQDFDNIKLNFWYMPEPLPNLLNFNDDSLVPSSSSDLFSYKVHNIAINKGETKTLQIEVKFLASGVFKLKSIDMMFLGIVPLTHMVPDVQFSKYSVIKVTQVSTGNLEVVAQGLKKELYFGEIQHASLNLSNRSTVDIEEVYLISTEPLYTGFGFKALGKIAANQTLPVDYYIRGINPKLNTLSLFVVYRTNNTWKYCSYSFDVLVNKSFVTRYHSEDLEDGKRMICVDLISGRDQSHVEAEDLEVGTLRLNSNTWSIVKNSQYILRDKSMMLIYFKVEERPKIVPETQYLTRKHREVSLE